MVITRVNVGNSRNHDVQVFLQKWLKNTFEKNVEKYSRTVLKK